jgi:hypothetical protein
MARAVKISVKMIYTHTTIGAQEVKIRGNNKRIDPASVSFKTNQAENEDAIIPHLYLNLLLPGNTMFMEMLW